MQKKHLNKPIRLNLPQKGIQTLPIGKAMLLVQTWIKQNQYQAAIHVLKQITEQLPSFADAWIMLFGTIEKTGNFEALISECESCLASKPRFVPALMSLSVAKRMRLEHDEALALINKAIAIEPKNSELHNILGIIMKETGNSEAALNAFNHCLKLNPKHTAAIWNKSDLPDAINADEFENIKTLAENKKLNPRERSKLFYALARSKAIELSAEQEFDLIHQGAEQMRSVVNYQHEDELALINNISEHVTTDTGLLSENTLDSCPIFICGLPRSGTTLVEQILSSHSEIMAGDELNDLPIATSKVLKRTFIKKPFPLWFNKLESEDWQQIAVFYLSSTKNLQSKRFFTDKHLMNYKAIGVIRKAFPQAKIIVCTRDPMDNLWGCYRQYFSNGLTFTYDLEQLADIIDAHHSLITHWRDIGVPFLEIKHENLVRNPEQEIKRMLDYIGADFEESCLTFYDNERSVRTTSATQVRQPLTDKNIGYWQRFHKQLAHISQRFEP